MTSDDAIFDIQCWSKTFDDPVTFFTPTTDVVKCMNKLSADLYEDLVSTFGGCGDNDLPELYVDGLEQEQIYEQIKMIKGFHDSSMKAPALTGEKLAAEAPSSDESEDSGADEEEETEEEESEEEDDSAEESNDSGNVDNSDVKKKKPSATAAGNRWEKSEVDDEFFNIRQMEKFLDDEDAKANQGGGGGDINYFDEVQSDDDDDEDGGLFDGDESGSDDDLKAELENDDGGDGDYDDDGGDDDEKDAKDLKHDDYFGEESEEEEAAASDDDDDEEEMEEEEVEEDEQPEEDVEVVNDKPWQMRGEATSEARDVNTLLEEAAQFDHATRPQPQITDDFTFNLESIIKRRIQDKAYDSVVRKMKDTRDPLAFKKKIVLDSEKSKLSLNEIYEKEYLKQANKDKEEEEDANHVEIRSMMRSLFSQMDAMSDFSFKPSAPTPEIKVVSNLPAVNMEDVQPVTHSNSQMLAPEEVLEKKDLVAKEEKTKEERKRDHRKKKIRQKVHAQQREKKLVKQAETSDKAKGQLAMQQLEKSSKLPSSSTTIIKDTGEKQSRSSKAFFTQLQENQQTAKEGKKRKLM